MYFDSIFYAGSRDIPERDLNPPEYDYDEEEEKCNEGIEIDGVFFKFI